MNNGLIYVYVATGGAFGACFRYFISEFVLNWLGRGFPFATLIVNITGSLIMGALYGLIEQGVIDIVPYRALIGVGFLGALTTFSTFSLDTLLLMQQGEILKATLNVLLNVTLCVLAASLGMFLCSK